MYDDDERICPYCLQELPEDFDDEWDEKEYQAKLKEAASTTTRQDALKARARDYEKYVREQLRTKGVIRLGNDKNESSKM